MYFFLCPFTSGLCMYVCGSCVSWFTLTLEQRAAHNTNTFMVNPPRLPCVFPFTHTRVFIYVLLYSHLWACVSKFVCMFRCTWIVILSLSLSLTFVLTLLYHRLHASQNHNNNMEKRKQHKQAEKQLPIYICTYTEIHSINILACRCEFGSSPTNSAFILQHFSISFTSALLKWRQADQ